MFKVNKKKLPEQRHWRHSGVFIVNFEHISDIFVSIVDFEQVNVGWVNPFKASDSNHKETTQLIFKANQLTGFYMIQDISVFKIYRDIFKSTLLYL